MGGPPAAGGSVALRCAAPRRQVPVPVPVAAAAGGGRCAALRGGGRPVPARPPASAWPSRGGDSEAICAGHRKECPDNVIYSGGSAAPAPLRSRLAAAAAARPPAAAPRR